MDSGHSLVRLPESITYPGLTRDLHHEVLLRGGNTGPLPFIRLEFKAAVHLHKGRKERVLRVDSFVSVHQQF